MKLSGLSFSGGLPSGVTLQAIDGETMLTSTTMSNNYYARNSYTVASGNGWDNPTFFPIGLGAIACSNSSALTATQWVDLSINLSLASTTDSDYTVMAANSIFNMQQCGGSALPSLLANSDSMCVGLVADDEPGTYSAFEPAIAGTANNIQDTRFWHVNMTWNQLAPNSLSGAPAPGTTYAAIATPITTPSGKKRIIDVFSTDVYWCAGANDNANTGGFDNSQMLFPPAGGGGTATEDETSRGSNYGYQIDFERECALNTNFTTFQYAGMPWQATGPIPLWLYVETGGPYTEDTVLANYITPPQINWAVWSCIIHGARGILYFDNTFTGPGANGSGNLGSSYFQTIQSPNVISIYNQVKNTDLLVKQLAPVINSPFAKGYVSVNSPNAATQFAGVECMAKWYQGGNVTNAGLALVNGFYVFAATRQSTSAGTLTVTFTLADTSATSVTVVGESRSISVVGGQFSDTFASGPIVHIYQVNG